MSIKVNFEIGHEASIRTKRTPEGFTHDWEVFVRGVEGADLSQFVDKVVFQLHETFPKPKRVVKEPPYCVKQSGYAGFNLPIEIYLKNRDEPKNIRFNYDLHLQQSGPAIIKVQKEKHVFTNPSDEFKRKLLKGGGMIVSSVNPFLLHVEHERDSRDSFTDDKPSQLIGKPKLGGDSSKKHKTKDFRTEDLPRPTNSFVNLFGPPIHKTSRISPDPKKPSPNPKLAKKDKEKLHSDKTKPKHDSKEREYREEKTKLPKEEKERLKEEKRSKGHKERDSSKEKSSKRPAERPPSPAPVPKRPAPPSPAPPRQPLPEQRSKPIVKPPDLIPPHTSPKPEKKSKKEKKSHDKDRENKKEHKKDKEFKLNTPEFRDNKPKDIPKEIPIKPNPVPKEKEKLPTKPEKPGSKYLIEMKPKDLMEAGRIVEGKHKDKGDKERKHKHKKKDKKRDESREKKDPSSKEKKHKHDKSKEKSVSQSKEPPPIIEQIDTSSIPREIDKITPSVKSFKEKDRSQLTISPISLDASSPSSSRSASKSSKTTSNALSSMIEALSCSSNSESEDVSILSDDDEDDKPTRNIKQPIKMSPEEPMRLEPIKPTPVLDTSKNEKQVEKFERMTSSHKAQKSKDKTVKQETREEKKQKKRKSNSKTDESESSTKTPKVSDDSEHPKTKRSEPSSADSAQRVRSEPSPRTKSDTKVQDDGVSSSLSDHPMKCESPGADDISHERKPISPDYMIQLKELQRRIMTIQSNEELERVVNLIAETGKFEVTKKTFDFDLCLLDRTTVQQLQELIGCESRA